MNRSDETETDLWRRMPDLLYEGLLNLQYGQSMKPAPLVGLKVLDLSRILAGPYCTQLLADLGADVIKVESLKGDDTRQFGPPFVGGESTYFLSINRGKRSIAIDLKSSKGLRVVHDLAAWADVVVENFRPGVAERLGVGYDALNAINPRLIYVSISGYGHRGEAPYTEMPGYDLVIQGVGGIPSLTGPEQGPPYKMGASVADLVSGLNAFGGLLAALYSRERNGAGRKVDIGMFDGQLSLLAYFASAALNTGESPARLGNEHPSICPYGTFEASDGHFNIACGNDGLFEKLCVAIGKPTLAQDPRFSSNVARVGNRNALLEQIGPILEAHSVQTWLDRIGEAGVPCGPILEVPEALAHPQAAARDMVVELSHPSAGTIRTVGSPSGFERSTFATHPPPRLSEHAQEVLTDVLGYTKRRASGLFRSGAVLSPEGD